MCVFFANSALTLLLGHFSKPESIAMDVDQAASVATCQSHFLATKLGASAKRFVTTAKAFGRAALDAVMPPRCVLCGADGVPSGFCLLCRTSLLQTWPPHAVACRFCGMPRPSEPSSLHDERCHACRQQTFGFDEVLVLGVYQDCVREAVVAAKLARHAALAKSLGALLAIDVQQRLDGKTAHYVTYVPSHFGRRLYRQGLGCPVILAQAIGQRLGIAAVPLVTLTRQTCKQSLLPDEERPANVRGAFALKKRYVGASPDLGGRHILLVDDVLTTGSTSSEIAHVLKNAGAASVTLAVIARAVRR